MSAIDVEKLLQAVSDDSPCGEDLEYDPAFQELERAATPDVGSSMVGDEVAPEPPKWRDVGRLAENVLERSKDLRAVMFLTAARANTHGIKGLADGIALINGLLSEYWDDVHPRLDEEDDNDPTMRINSLAGLGDPDGIVKDLRNSHIVVGQRAGSYSLHDIRLASGELPAPEGTEAPEFGIIEAAFQEIELDDLQALADAVAKATDDLRAVETQITEKVGAANNSLDVDALAAELNAISKIYAQQLANRGVDVEDSGDATEEVAQRAISGEITSREDAVRMLDKVSEYFRRHEPSSPVPYLLQRAKGLVAKDFMEILQDLTPDAIAQAEMYTKSRQD